MKYSATTSFAILAALASSATNAFTPSPMNQGLKTCRPSTYLSDIRFNKCPASNKIEGTKKMEVSLYTKKVHTDIYPLTYPLNEVDAKILRTETLADSVVLSSDAVGKRGDEKYNTVGYWLKDPITEAVIQPLYPGDPGFEEELAEVVEARHLRRRRTSLELKIPKKADLLETGEFTTFRYNRWPDLWYNRKGRSSVDPFTPRPRPTDEIGPMDPPGLRLEDVADAVKGEYPNYHQQTFIAEVVQQSRKDEKNLLRRDLLKSDYKKVEVVDFIGDIIRMSAINTWVIDAVAPVNFMLKWHFGVPRPEEMAYAVSIFEGEPDDPDDPKISDDNLVKKIKSLNLENAASFTAYENGSPTHPSFPAMHSAGGTLSLWLPALYDISDKQYAEALRIDYGVAMARTVAGVHYPQDNIAGLNIGQRVVREQLPQFLEDNYGYDAKKVKSRLESLSFDWTHFKSYDFDDLPDKPTDEPTMLCRVFNESDGFKKLSASGFLNYAKIESGKWLLKEKK